MLIIIIAALVIAFTGAKKLKIPTLELKVHKRQRFERIRWIFNEYIPSNENPVLFQRGAVLRDSGTGKNMLQLKFINVSPKQIKSAYTTIRFFDDAGDILTGDSTIQAEYLDINCESNGTFGQKQLLELGNIGAIHISVQLDKAVFADGTVWRAERNVHPQKSVKVTALKSTLPPELQNEVSEELICKPEVLTDGIWRCTCGCLADSGESCSNCHRTFEKAQEDTSINTLKRQLQKRIAEQEQKALEEEIAKKESKEYIIQFVFAFLTIFLGSFGVNAGISFISNEFHFFEKLSPVESLYGIICAITLLSTAFLVRRSRCGDTAKEKIPIENMIKIQGITALTSCIICTSFCLIVIVVAVLSLPFIFSSWDPIKRLMEAILAIVLMSILAMPNIIYCIKVPYAKNWFSKHKPKSKRNIK